MSAESYADFYAAHASPDDYPVALLDEQPAPVEEPEEATEDVALNKHPEDASDPAGEPPADEDDEAADEDADEDASA